MKSKFFIIFLIILNQLQELRSQNGLPQNAGARGAAMGNAALCFKDVASLYANQAGIAFLEGYHFSAYGERRFLSEGMNLFQFAAAANYSKIGSFGLQINYFGFDQYNEQKIGLAYARKLAKNFSMSVQFDYLATRIPEYGVSSSFTAEIGLLADLSPKVSLAAHVYNPLMSKINDQNLPTLLAFGVMYKPSEKFLVSGQLEKDIFSNPFTGRFGMEYTPINNLAIRLGIIAGQPLMVSLGLGVVLQSLRIDIASSYHQILGFTPSLSVSYGFKPQPKAAKKEEKEYENPF